MPRTKFTTFTVRTDIVQGIGWATISEHLGFRSVGAWLTSLAEERHKDFADLGYEAAERRRARYLLSEEDEREKPLTVNVRRAYRSELDRLYNLALSTPELQPSFRVFMDKAEFNHRLFEASEPESATLIAERRSRILGFLFATIEKRSARLVFLAVRPECRRRGIGTALYEALRGILPRDVVVTFGGYVPVESPAVAFLEKLGYLPGKSFVWMDRYA